MASTTKVISVLDAFFEDKPLITVHKKQILISPDDEASYFYYIHSGYIRSYSITEWGDEKLGFIYKEKEILPLIWIFDQKPVTRYYEAMGEAQVRKCKVNDFLAYAQKEEGALFDLAHRAAAIIEVFGRRIDALEYTKAYARVISLLLLYVSRFGKKKFDNSYVIQVPISHKDIASGIAVARETVTRELMKLERKGLITTENHFIRIVSLSKLEEEISDFYLSKTL